MTLPLARQLTAGGLTLTAVEPTGDVIAASDCVRILANHSSFDCAVIAGGAVLVVDTRNALKADRKDRASIVTL